MVDDEPSAHLGLQEPDSGEVSKPNDHRIGYLPQEASIFRGLTVEDNVMAVAELTEKNPARARQLTADVELDFMAMVAALKRDNPHTASRLLP